MSDTLIERVIDWLGRRHAVIHRADETSQRAEARLSRVELVIEAQRHDGAPGVNVIYDRLTSQMGERHG